MYLLALCGILRSAKSSLFANRIFLAAEDARIGRNFALTGSNQAYLKPVIMDFRPILASSAAKKIRLANNELFADRNIPHRASKYVKLNV